MPAPGFVRSLTSRFASDWAVRRLKRIITPEANTLAAAVRTTLAETHARAARAWFDRIEALRAELEHSAEEIRRTDYGAGTPVENRSDATMAVGVVVVDQLGRIVRVASKQPFWCRLLFELVRNLRPASCVELGTAVGLSAAYQAAALELNEHGRLATLEGAESLAAIARRNLQQLELQRVDIVTGRFQDTLSGVLAERGPVDFLFIDGHHDETATVRYFLQAVPALAPGAVVVFDDIKWSAGMARAWSTIHTNPQVDLAVDFGPLGLCVIRPGGARPKLVKLPLT